MKTVDEIIKHLAERSKTKEHSLILNLLNYCKANGIIEVTQEKANAFYDELEKEAIK